MASQAKRLPANQDGDFFVDSSCIDCATCRWMAPESYDSKGKHSRIYKQPETETEIHQALMALVACPTSSIGTTNRHDMQAVLAAFPDLIEDNVYHCGYHSEASFGATSYFIRRKQGNILIDSPRYATVLVKQLEELGGVDTMFLTHKDDVADHEKFAKHFGCNRILHQDDITENTQSVEVQLKGAEDIAFADDITLIPVPGHTKGSVCLLYQNKFLFSGDHLFYNPKLAQLYASKRVCWYDYAELKKSVTRLMTAEFEWVLPGHGTRIQLPRDQMKSALQVCIDQMTD